MSASAIHINRVSHRYGELLALDDVSFQVAQGELCALLGPNGSGKTTLFRVLSTLLTPTVGSAQVFGADVEIDPSTVRSSIGVVFQQPALDERLTIEENLRFHGALYGMYGDSLSKRIRHLLLAFGLGDRARDRVDTLSGGLRRRADLARGLLHSPPLLLLDEPTTGLDPVARRSLWRHLTRLQREEGTTLLVATHLMQEAEQCDNVIILNEGQVAADGTPQSLTSELGEETLWLESNQPELLQQKIEGQFGITSRIIGEELQFSHPEAHSLLSPFYESFGDHIISATVRQPTLEDVFIVRTGNRPDVQQDSPKAEVET